MIRQSALSMLALALVASWVTADAAPDHPARTLHPNELWGVFGGDPVQGCCGVVDGCEAEHTCDEQENNILCRSIGRDDEEQPQNQKEECKSSMNPGDSCEEGLFTDVCRKRWRCRFEFDEEWAGCVRDTNPEITGNPTDTEAPNSCSHNCM